LGLARPEPLQHRATVFERGARVDGFRCESRGAKGVGHQVRDVDGRREDEAFPVAGMLEVSGQHVLGRVRLDEGSLDFAVDEVARPHVQSVEAHIEPDAERTQIAEPSLRDHLGDRAPVDDLREDLVEPGPVSPLRGGRRAEQERSVMVKDAGKGQDATVGLGGCVVGLIDDHRLEVRHESGQPVRSRERLHGGEDDLVVMLITLGFHDAHVVQANNVQFVERLANQLISMHEDERAAAPLPDQFDEDHGLSGARG